MSHVLEFNNIETYILKIEYTYQKIFPSESSLELTLSHTTTTPIIENIIIIDKNNIEKKIKNYKLIQLIEDEIKNHDF